MMTHDAGAQHAIRESSMGLTRTALGVGALVLLGWLAIAAPGCASHGHYTAAHKSGAKEKLEAVKAASEFTMAKDSFLAGDLEKGLQHVDYSLSLKESVAISHILRGRILMEMGDLEGANRSLSRGAEIDPKNPEAPYYNGILSERLNQPKLAQGFYQKAAELDPQNAQYVVSAAEMLIAQGELDAAEQYLKDRTQLYQYNSGLRQTLGHVELLKGNAEQAAGLFNEARLLAPNDSGILEDLVRAQMASGRWGEAEFNLQRLLKDDKDGVRRDLIHMRAQCLVQLDRVGEARQLFLKLTSDQAGAGDADAWVGLGEVALSLKDLPRVKNCASRVIALAPERAEGYTLRAMYLQRSGDVTGAARVLEAAPRSARNADSLVMLGMLRQDLGQRDGARQAYAEALRNDPQNQNAAQLLTALDRTAAAHE